MTDQDDLAGFLESHHPFDAMASGDRDTLISEGAIGSLSAGDPLFATGDRVGRYSILLSGTIDLIADEGDLITRYQAGEGVGARMLLRGGVATATARATEDCSLLQIPARAFHSLLERSAPFRAFNARHVSGAHRALPASPDPAATMVSTPISDLMTPDPIMVPEDTTVADAADLMTRHRISCVLVGEAGNLTGMLTTGDLTGRVLAAGRDGTVPVHAVMTPDPATLSPDTPIFEALLLMSERSFGHLPIVAEGRTVGIVTRTNLIRRQTVSAVSMIVEIGKQDDPAAFKRIVDGVPGLLSQLVGSGVEPHHIGQLITSVTDAVTRRLLVLAERDLGPPPVPYLWLACGSQGRQEQTGVSDQDNCLILDDAYDESGHGAYFEALARSVCDGLNACGYFYCPGDMMATNPRWRQPLAVWRRYFQGWIDRPDPKAQMLSSVMFDLRPIAGEEALFQGLQRETLEAAKKNSIFRAHLIANSLKHQPPLSLFRGFALVRSGEHKNMLDLKHSGTVPIVDLARVYALDGGVEDVNTRARLLGARAAGSLSKGGADDLVDALDLIGRTRLENQARQIREGEAPDNFMAPSSLSALERSHLKDAFGVVKSLQSTLGALRSAG